MKNALKNNRYHISKHLLDSLLIFHNNLIVFLKDIICLKKKLNSPATNKSENVLQSWKLKKKKINFKLIKIPRTLGTNLHDQKERKKRIKLNYK